MCLELNPGEFLYLFIASNLNSTGLFFNITLAAKIWLKSELFVFSPLPFLHIFFLFCCANEEEEKEDKDGGPFCLLIISSSDLFFVFVYWNILSLINFFFWLLQSLWTWGLFFFSWNRWVNWEEKKGGYYNVLRSGFLFFCLWFLVF